MVFDGFTATGTQWNPNTPIVSPAWDPDNNGASFTNNELLRIQGAWQRVVADFSAFDVDVTTEDPGEANLVNTGGSDDRWGIRVVITLDDTPAPGTGGVAYIGSFAWGYNRAGASDTPCYVFNSTAATVSAAASHEVGHSLGLSHDGTTSAHPTDPSQVYYNGHGTGENAWGPIMGSGYYSNVTTWDNGTYFASNNGGANANYSKGPNDLTVMTGYGFDFIPDAESDSLVAATGLQSTIDFGASINNISQFGLIAKPNDVDYFSFQTGTGLVSLSFDPYVTQTFVHSSGSYSISNESAFFGANWSNNQGSNLDISATLYDSQGFIVAVSDPAGLRAGFSNLQLTAGEYYVSVEGVGFADPTLNPPDGYTDYGSLGQYIITGTLPVALGLIVPAGPLVYTEDSAPVQVTNSATVFDGIPGNYDGSKLDVTIVAAPGATDRLAFDSSLTGLVASSGSIQENGQTIAVQSVAVSTRLSFTLTAAATAQSIEALIRSVTFQAQGNAPDTTARTIRFKLTKGTLSGTGDMPVIVTPLNDAPTMQAATMASVLEDAIDSEGQSVSELFTPAFNDPDPGSSLKGIAVSQNNTPLTEGVWQYAFGSSLFWRNLPAVSGNARLALSLTGKLRFMPGTDFNGFVTPLQVHGIDETYTGSFSTPNTLVFLPASLTGPTSPVSINISPLNINVLPVNDAPRPQVSELTFSVVQNDTLSASIPPGSIIDIDDSTLTYTAIQADGNSLPAWLSIDPLTGTFSGTPGAFDVRTLRLSLVATDAGGLTASLPVVIDVINVNDPPSDLRFVGGTVRENTSGTAIGLLTGFDPDGDTIFWSSSDPRFIVRDGEVFLNTALDFENPLDRAIPVVFRAGDIGVPPLSSDLNVVVTTLDVNEFYPLADSRRLEVVDGTEAGTTLANIFAADGDTQQTVRYRLHSGDINYFTINPATGELKLALTADLDTKQQLKVFIDAYDDGSPSFSSTAQYIFDVVPRNLFAPQFDLTQSLTFAENVPNNTHVGTVDVSDQDGNPFIIELLDVGGGSANWLRVDSATGSVYTTASRGFDFESGTNYSLQVRVTETIPGGHVVTGTIQIALTNANDRPTGVGGLAIYPNRFGTPVTSVFVVQDQDPSATGYTFSTTDPRFEIRDGRLALKPDQVLSSSSVGQQLQVAVQVIDNSDLSSFSNLVAQVQVVAAATWQNPLNQYDVNRDTILTPFDALAVINALNNSGANKSLPPIRPVDMLDNPDLDTSGDNLLSAIDALRVINQLNAKFGAPEGPEGEADEESVTAGSNLVDVQQAWLAAYSQIEDETLAKRRR